MFLDFRCFLCLKNTIRNSCDTTKRVEGNRRTGTEWFVHGDAISDEAIAFPTIRHHGRNEKGMETGANNDGELEA